MLVSGHQNASALLRDDLGTGSMSELRNLGTKGKAPPLIMLHILFVDEHSGQCFG